MRRSGPRRGVPTKHFTTRVGNGEHSPTSEQSNSQAHKQTQPPLPRTNHVDALASSPTQQAQQRKPNVLSICVRRVGRSVGRSVGWLTVPQCHNSNSNKRQTTNNKRPTTTTTTLTTTNDDADDDQQKQTTTLTLTTNNNDDDADLTNERTNERTKFDDTEARQRNATQRTQGRALTHSLTHSLTASLTHSLTQ